MSETIPIKKFTAERGLRERVTIDGDQAIIGFVTSVQFRLNREPLYEVSYVHNGVAQAPWIEEFRLRTPTQ